MSFPQGLQGIRTRPAEQVIRLKVSVPWELLHIWEEACTGAEAAQDCLEAMRRMHQKLEVGCGPGMPPTPQDEGLLPCVLA